MVTFQLPSAAQSFYWNRDPQIPTWHAFNKSSNWTSNADGTGPWPASIRDDDFTSSVMGGQWSCIDADNYVGSVNCDQVTNTGKLTVNARGADMWGATNEFVAAKRGDIQGDFDVTVKVLSVSGTDPAAKGGIMVANNFVNLGLGGYAILCITSSGTAKFEIDLSGPMGELENFVNTGTLTFPVYLRMVRSGSSLLGFYRTSQNSAWTQIGSAQTPQGLSNAPSQVGLFSCAHSASTPGASIFDDFQAGADIAASGLDYSFGGTGANADADVLITGEVYANGVDFTGYAGILDFGRANGLYATLYPNNNLAGGAVERFDTDVNFNWGSASPDGGIAPTDDFSIRWEGMVKPEYSETYTFYVNADDGKRLWVNNQLLIDQWTAGSGEYSGTITLTAGIYVPIRLEYFDGTGPASCTLSWSSASVAKTPVPGTAFSASRLAVQANASFSPGMVVAANAGLLEFAGNLSHSFTPKAGAAFPVIVNSGTGTVTVQNNGLNAGGLILAGGEWNWGASTLTHTVGFIDASTGGGTMTFGSNLVKIGMDDCNLSGLTVLNADAGTLEFISSNAQTFTPKPGGTHPAIVKNGAGTLTVAGTALLTSDLKVTAGTLDISTNAISLTSGDMLINGGSLEADGANLDANGDFQMTSGTLHPPQSPNPFTIAGSFIQTGGTLTPGNGTVTLDGANTGKLLNASSLLNKLAINGGGVWTVTGTGLHTDQLMLSYGTLNLGNSLTSVVETSIGYGSPPSLDFGASTLRFKGTSLNLGGVGTLTPGTGTLEFAGTAQQTFIPKYGATHPGIKQNGNGGTVISNYDLIAASLSVAQGTLDLGTGSHTVLGNVAFSGGTLDFNGATLLLHAASVDLHLLAGIIAGTGTLEFADGNPQTFVPLNAAQHPNIRQSGAGGTTITTNDLNANVLLPAGGVFHMGSGRSHSFTAINAGGGPYGGLDFASSQVHVTGTVNLATATSLTAGTGSIYLSASTGTQTFAPKGNVMVPAIFHDGGGILQLYGNSLNCQSFTQTAGRLDFNGFDITTGSAGDFTLVNGNSSTLSNLLGRHLVVGGNAVLSGQANSHLNLNPDSIWFIDVTGTLRAVNSDIRNSHALHPGGIADSSLNQTGNANWFFPDTLPPGNVTAFQARALDGHSAELTWTASIAANADSVMLRFRTDGAYPSGPGDGTLWRTLGKALLTDTVTGLPDKSILRFAAFARDSSGNFAVPDAGAQDTARTPDVTAPSNVAGFTATATEAATAPGSRIALAWTASASPDADSLMIRYRTDGAYPAALGDGTLLKKVSLAANVDTVTGLAPNLVYHFGVFARDSAGNYSAPSAGARDTALWQESVYGSVAISDQSGSTRDPDPALAFAYSGADSMRFSRSADTAAAAWKPVHAVDSLDLGAGNDGSRIVLAQYKNRFGTLSPWSGDTTKLDRTGPEVTLALNVNHGWKNWPGAVAGHASDAIAGTDSVFVIRRRVADLAYFNGSGWTTVADTAKFRADSAFAALMPLSALNDGVYDFTAYAKDKLGNTSAPLTVRVNYLENRAPSLSATDLPNSTLQNQAVAWRLDMGDRDEGDSVLTMAATLPGWLILTQAPDSARDGYAAHRVYTFTGKPGQADVGSATMTVQVIDLGGKTTVYSKSIVVVDVNDAPEFASGQDTAVVQEDAVRRITLKLSDPDANDPRLLTLMRAPGWVTLQDGVLTLRPGSKDVGTAQVAIVLSDGSLQDTLEIAVAVADVNDAPVAFPSADWESPFQWKEDRSGGFTVVVVDMDPGDSLSQVTPLPTWMTCKTSRDNGNAYNRFFKFSVSPAQADTGSYDLRLRFRDAAGAFSDLPLRAKVAAVNDTPTAVIKGSISQAGAARIGMDVVDPDGDASTTRFHYRLIGAAGDTVRRGICAGKMLDLHPLGDGEYTLAVAAEDEGGLKQAIFTRTGISITGATALFLDSARWNMLGYPGRSLAATALIGTGGAGAGANVTGWDESSEDGAPLGRYATGPADDSLKRGKGYWVRVAKPVLVKVASSDLLDRPFTMKLTHGKQGWNQVGNPFPYYLDLSSSGLQFWEWDALRRDLANAHGILKPWGAYWVQVSKDTVLTLKDAPYFANPAALAKTAASMASDDRGPSFDTPGGTAGWTLQLAVRAGPYQDQGNYLGIHGEKRGEESGKEPGDSPSASSPMGGMLPDAPKFGDYVALHLNPPGAAATAESKGHEKGYAAYGYATDFRSRAGADGEDEWWDFSLENSATGLEKAELTLPGLQALETAGLHAFLVRKGETLPVSAGIPVVLAMAGAETHYSLVITPRADFAARLQGDFSLAQNFPNPVLSETRFRFSLPQSWDSDGKRQTKDYRVRLNVYDFSGRLAARIVEGGFGPGSHTLLWKGGGALAKGTYAYRLETPGFAKTLKLLVK
ncbi:MAG: PA14 domain-containing protein [Fibrobacteria bacterium]